jgi:Tfp pilus assembly protein PilP
MTGKMKVVIRALILFFFIVCPLRVLNSQEQTAPADDTLKQGYKIIKDSRKNKADTVDQATEKKQEGEVQATPPPTQVQTGEEAPSQDQAHEKAPLAQEEKAPYDTTGMRDPFKPFIKLVETPVGSAPTVLLPPIQRYSLNQFRIVGIVWISGRPQAMVVDPEANTYFLGVGDKIGNSDGEILEVRENGILVQEKAKIENVYGDVKVEIKKSVLAFQDEE